MAEEKDGEDDKAKMNGCFELNIPVLILQNCYGIKTGEKVELNGTNQKPGSGVVERISVYAEKNGDWLSLKFLSSTLGSIFQEKLTELWQCYVLSIDKVAKIPSTLSVPKDASDSSGVKHECVSDKEGPKDTKQHSSDKSDTEDVIQEDHVDNESVSGNITNQDSQICEATKPTTQNLKQLHCKDAKNLVQIDIEAGDGNSKTPDDQKPNKHAPNPRGNLKATKLKEKRKIWKTEKTDIKDVQCKFCDRTWFSSFKCYHRHLNSCFKNPENAKEETPEEKEQRLLFTCKICNMSCGKNRLKRHLEIAHNVLVKKKKPCEPNLENRCKFCNETFTSVSTLQRHRKYRCLSNPNVKVGALTQCKYCSSQVEHDLLEDHIKRRHPNGHSGICDICGKIFHTRVGLLSHKRRHLYQHGGKNFPCHVCGKKFPFKYQYEEHLTVHSDEKTIICDLCGKSFKTRKALGKHVATFHHNKYQYHCAKCGHGMDKKKYLETHKCDRVRRVQMKKPEEDLSQTHVAVESISGFSNIGNGDFQFPEMDMVTTEAFFSQSDQHELEVKSSDFLAVDHTHDDMKELVCTEQDEVRRFPCNLCTQRFKHKHHLERHVRNVHERLYSFHCEFCGHGFEDERNRKTHVCGNQRIMQTL